MLNLNTNQSAAIEWDDSPLLVLAGPGSGKTTVLVERMLRTVASDPGAHFRALGVTFTNAAADEMRERILSRHGIDSARFFLCTFHSLASSILQQHGSHIGLTPNFSIMTEESDRVELLAEIVEGHDLDLEQGELKTLPLLAKLYESCRSADDIRRVVPDPAFCLVMTEIYKHYARIALFRGTLDFPLLVFLARQLFDRYPVLARQFRRTYRCIAVDEFQDTNEAQFLFLKSIVGESASGLFVVADDDQTIYQWNGASPKRLQELCSLYQMTVIQLPESFRCPPSIVKAANFLISHNTNRAQRLPLVPARPDSLDYSLEVKSYASFDDELDALVRQLRERKEGSTAVLGRSKRLLEPAIAKARNANLPVYSPIKKSSFVSTPLLFLLSILRLASKPNDANSAKRFIRAFELLSGEHYEYATLDSLAQAEGSDFLSVWCKLADRSSSGVLSVLIKTIESELIQRKIYRNVPLATFEFVDSCLSDFKVEALAGLDLDDYDDERQIWGLMQRKAGLPGQELLLSEFLREIDMSPKVLPAEPDSIQFLTVHTAKGLEFDSVYLIGVAESYFPAYQAVKLGDQSRAMQEERRSFFVAITRTAKYLRISFSEMYFGWRVAPSRFIAEMNSQ